MGAPDKIWMSQPDEECEVAVWFDPDEGGIEYIRADLVQSLIRSAQDLDSQYCDDDLGPSALAMGKLREAYMRIK